MFFGELRNSSLDGARCIVRSSKEPVVECGGRRVKRVKRLKQLNR